MTEVEAVGGNAVWHFSSPLTADFLSDEDWSNFICLGDAPTGVPSGGQEGDDFVELTYDDTITPGAVWSVENDVTPTFEDGPLVTPEDGVTT